MRHPITLSVLLYVLCVLMVMDVVTTFVGVGIMGAIELSPICVITGFWLFMVIKVVASVTCVYVSHKFCIPSAPTASACMLVFLIALYVVVCAYNFYQIAGQIS